jgi:hypothetical protein
LTPAPSRPPFNINTEKHTTVEKVQLFMPFALFTEEQVNLEVSGVLETAR